MSVKNTVFGRARAQLSQGGLPQLAAATGQFLSYKVKRSDAFLRRKYGVTPAESRARFLERFFEPGEYERYRAEFEDGPAAKLVDEALARYRQMTGNRHLSGIGLDRGRDYYALVRALKPETMVETGVCNGISSLCVLLAMDRNERGTLYSIDFPFRADESLDEFRAETFDEYGGAAIPADKDPGWIVPDELCGRWDLTIGKSQRKLPEVLTEVGEIDVFAHDSEHSSPCMLFEYDLAWEWLNPGGVLLSDDISWNDAMETFVDVRNPDFGLLSPNVAYAAKR